MVLPWGLPLLSTLMGCSLSNPHCTTSVTDYELATSQGLYKLQIPTSLAIIKGEMESLQEEINIQQEDFLYSTNLDEDRKKISVPKVAQDMTLSRAKCLESQMESATIEEILQSNLHKTFRTLKSTSYLTQSKGQTTCFIRKQEANETCWNSLQDLITRYSLNTNIEALKFKMRNISLGILAVNSNSLDLVSSKALMKLPCVGSTSDQQPTLWKTMKENFIKPKLEHLQETYNNLETQLKLTKKDSREKRSIMSSIFGLASAGDVETLRKALMAELSNQQTTNAAMEKMLRTQIKQAERINEENQKLFEIQAEEEGMKNSLMELTEYLETAMTNTTKNSHSLDQKVMTMLHYTSTMTRIDNLMTKVETLLDLVHCPYGTCTRIIDELSAKHNIGNIKTYPLIGELLYVEATSDKIIITLHNITLQEGAVIKVKCLPFMAQGEQVKTHIEGTYQVNTGKGFYKVEDECDRSHGLIYCNEQPLYQHNTCLEDILSLHNNNSVNCEDFIRQTAGTSKQDMLIKDDILEVWSAVEDSIRISSKKEQYKGSLAKGTNYFKLPESKQVKIDTRFLSYTRNQVPVKTYQESVNQKQNQPSEEVEMKLLSTMIESVETKNLVQIENHITSTPKLQGEADTLEVPEFTTAHPVLVYLQDIETSWYIYALVFLVVLMVGYMLLAWKCTLWPFKRCRKARKENRNDIEASEEETEYESMLMKTPEEAKQDEVKYSDMRMENLGFITQLRANFQGTQIGWTGKAWRTLSSNTLIPLVKEPPSYMLNVCKPFEGELDLMEGKVPYICLKNFPNTHWDMVRQCWFLTEDNGERVFLPIYTHPAPGKELIDLLRLAKAENKVRTPRQ